jgi:Protein of unknown function (DUF3987)
MNKVTIDNLPNAGKQHVIRQIIAMYKSGAPVARLQVLHGCNPDITRTEVSPTEAPEQHSPLIPAVVYDNIPELLTAGCSVFNTHRERDVFLTGAITILSGCFSEVTGLYDRKPVAPNLYSFTVAPAACGKGVLTHAKELGAAIQTTLSAETNANIAKYKTELLQFQAECKKAKAGTQVPTAPTEPQRNTLYIPANSSAAVVMKHINENGGRGIISETEADTMANSFRQEWGAYDDLLRKGFHHEGFSCSRKGNNEYIDIARPKISVALAGTPMQVARIIPSIENGLYSRFIFYCYNDSRQWRDVSPSAGVNLDAHFHALSLRVQVMYNKLQGQNTTFELTLNQWKRLNEYGSFGVASSDDDTAGTSIRMGLILFRLAMVLSVLRNENSLPSNGGRIICRDVDFDTALELAKVYREHAEHTYHSLLMPKGKIYDSQSARLLDALPAKTFTRKEAVTVGEENSIKTRTVDKYLHQLCSSGKLRKEKDGLYAKV